MHLYEQNLSFHTFTIIAIVFAAFVGKNIWQKSALTFLFCIIHKNILENLVDAKQICFQYMYMCLKILTYTTARVSRDNKGNCSYFSIKTYSQTCLKGSSKGRTKSGCLRQVTLNTGSFTLYFGSRDPVKVAG